MEPITLAKAGLAITKGGKALVALLSEQKKLDKIYAEICDEILSEVVARVAAIEARMDDEQQRRFEEEQAKPDAQAYARVLFQEAARSVTRERRIMLAASIAGGVTPDFKAEGRSRLARAMAQLEPSDVAILREFIDLADAEEISAHGLYQLMNDKPAASRQALIAAGCMEIRTASQTKFDRDGGRTIRREEPMMIAQITWIGSAVVHAVEGRLLSEQSPQSSDDDDTDG